MSRQIAIIHRNAEYAANAFAAAMKLSPLTDSLTVFAPPGMALAGISSDGRRIACETIPSEADTEPKIRNWINSRYSGYDGFLHVLTDTVEITKDPSAFVGDLENMMTALDYPVWFNTVCDGCNYVYSKYNPRMRIQCDRPECARLGLTGELDFTSHANTQWICYAAPALASPDATAFDERFTVPMFFIIEFLARRRNTKPAGSLFFMNQYLTVGSERGTFRNLPSAANVPPSPDAMKAEDAAFKAMNVDFKPDNNIDVVLETLWEKILSKTAAGV